MKHLPFLGLCLFAVLCLSLRARDLAAYRVGDVADADITTPVALDVVDEAATTTLQSAKAQQYPAVFRDSPAATNEMARDFLAAFAQTRTNFLTELAHEFHPGPLDAGLIASADFGRLVTAFGIENKNFPMTDELAGEWARGGEGQAIREKLLAVLVQAADRRIRPDVLPKGLYVGETVHLVSVTDDDQKVAFDVVQQSPLIPYASLMTVSNAQALLRREFPPAQPLVARALAAWLKPNCLPDVPFTQLTRGSAVYQVIVANHFDAGDAIVRQGATIDAKTKAALAALDEKLKSGAPIPQVAVAITAATNPPPGETRSETVLAPAAGTVALRAPTPAPAQVEPPPAPAPAAPAPTLARSPQKPVSKAAVPHEGLILTLTGASAVALAVACWQFWKERKRGLPSAPSSQTPLPLPGADKSNLTPQVTQAVREAVQQELAMQRRELLLAQQAATDEIAALVRRLDELQVPMQERLHTYETRIQVLEKELALRNEENRELLKRKIEMISQQLEKERAASLTPPMAA